MMNEGEPEFCNIIIFSASNNIMFTLNRTLHSNRQGTYNIHCNTFMMYTSIAMCNLVSTCSRLNDTQISHVIWL